jgi:hypothetical protein
MKKTLYFAAAAALLFPPLAFGKPVSLSNAAQLAGAGTENLRELEGTYALENGRRVKLSVEGDRLLIQLNRHDVFELEPLDSQHFATRDKKLTVRMPAGTGADKIIVEYDAQFKPATRRW